MKPSQRKKRTYGYLQKAKPPRRSKTYRGGKQKRKSAPALPQKTKKAIFRSMGWGIVTLGIFGFVAGTVMVAWVSRDLPDPDKLTDRQVAQSTKIYDQTGEHLLYEIFADQKRTLITLDQAPKNLVNGLIATEDRMFYEHKGIRPLSMVRSLVYGLMGRGRVGGGASTLTQQLVKNAILTNERTLTRKMKEIILSIRLEQKYSKDQILQIYFNEIPYGSTNYGVEAAAQSYFGKHVSDLTLAESATLAGLPKAPSKYLANPEAMKDRRDFVLQRMLQEGYIAKQQEEQAQAEPVHITLKQSFGDVAPHFVMYVKQQLVDKYGEQTVEQGGLNVITTLDWDKQQAARQAITEHTEVLKKAGANNVALVATDPKTGQVLAMIGSRDFFDESIDGQFNVAVDGKRQPGSSFKPIIYAAAFAKGYTPETILTDVTTNFAASGREYKPVDYDGKERGPVSVRQALQGSLNIPAVETLYLVGEQKGREMAERMGYTTLSSGDFGLTLVLGGGEVKLIEHTAAYGIFANQGVRQPTTSILRVENPSGDTLFEWKPSGGTRVLDDTITATVSNVLSDDAARAFVFGAGGVLTLPDRPVAAKTGTTNNYVDAWTVGYTPSLVSGVWAGNTNNAPMKQGYGGSRVAGQIWNQFMKDALKDTPVEPFPTPPGNDANKPILRGAIGGTVTVNINSWNGKIATSSTPPELTTERTYTLPHTILHYVNKDDPRGPAPEHPEEDPQYAIWESAFLDWITRKKLEEPAWNVSFEEPPTEYDDTQQSPELVPSLEILSPTASSTISSRQITADILVSAPRGVAFVVYVIDGQVADTVRIAPFNLNYFADALPNGAHTLTVRAEDDVGNATQKTVNFILTSP